MSPSYVSKKKDLPSQLILILFLMVTLLGFQIYLIEKEAMSFEFGSKFNRFIQKGAFRKNERHLQ